MDAVCHQIILLKPACAIISAAVLDFFVNIVSKEETLSKTSSFRILLNLTDNNL